MPKVESMPTLEGKRMSIILAPKKAGQPKKSQQRRDEEKAQEAAKSTQAPDETE